MIRRFSLYGFLKNQRYFEDWWLLAFRARGLTFTEWGLLIGFREVMINFMEVPSGAVADLFGRRRCMILSFVAYIASFVIFGAADHLALLFLGMALFAVGDAFRTGTHKAMIFTWLTLEGRADQKTRTYGYTRSWSKLGSALSVAVGTAIVLATGNYRALFYVPILPYVIGLVNFLTYPRVLEGDVRPGARASLGEVTRHLRETLVVCLRKAPLRRVLFESMGWHGLFKAGKDYLQPVLKVSAVLWLGNLLLTGELTEVQQAALLVGPVYLALHLAGAAASRHTHRLVARLGDEEGASRVLWVLSVVAFAAMIPAALAGVLPLLIAAFVVMHVMQNAWRPVLVSRFDEHSEHVQKATVLSIESQAGSLCAAVVAPVLGYAIDRVRATAPATPGFEFWPVGVIGAAVTLGFLLTSRRRAPRVEP
jgi:MFS family permease